MTKKEKLKLCNRVLLALVFTMLISSLQMELSGGHALLNISFELYMWIHVTIAVVMCSFVLWHLWLHFGSQNWFVRIKALPKKMTKVLFAFTLLMFITGIVSLIQLLVHGMEHGTVGGIHGKIGFVFLAIAIGHTLKRKKLL